MKSIPLNFNIKHLSHIFLTCPSLVYTSFIEHNPSFSMRLEIITKFKMCICQTVMRLVAPEACTPDPLYQMPTDSRTVPPGGPCVTP